MDHSQNPQKENNLWHLLYNEFVRRNGDESTMMFIDSEDVELSDAVLDMGIWCCPCCNKLNPVEESRCKACGEDKFIIRKSTEKSLE